MHVRRLLAATWLAAALLGAAALPVAAQSAPEAAGRGFTLYGAYRDGGSFTDAVNANKLGVEASPAFAASIDWPLDISRQLQLFLAHQSSKLRLENATVAAPGGVPDRLPLRITYLHLGGTNFFDGPIGQGPFVTGGIGATLLAPDGDFSRELRPSLHVGLGYELPLGTHLALRFEARAYFTLVNSSGSLFCDGGCTLSIKGDGFSQGEAQIGVALRF